MLSQAASQRAGDTVSAWGPFRFVTVTGRLEERDGLVSRVGADAGDCSLEQPCPLGNSVVYCA